MTDPMKFLAETFCQLWQRRVATAKRLDAWVDRRLWKRTKIGRSVRLLKRHVPFQCSPGEFETALRANGYRVVEGCTDADFIKCLD
jgi:hypothetical protein